jgi:hypothetical protein
MVEAARRASPRSPRSTSAPVLSRQGQFVVGLFVPSRGKNSPGPPRAATYQVYGIELVNLTNACCLALLSSASIAAAQESDPQSDPPAAGQHVRVEAFSGRSMIQTNGTLIFSQNPPAIELGPIGKFYVSGAFSGFGQWQTNAGPDDRIAEGDLSNAQLIVQKIDGPLQFYIQAGLYTQASLGIPFVNSLQTASDLYGIFPLAFAKLIPDDQWSILAGQIASLAGYEPTFTFQNMNVQRGLLWNPTSSVSRGVQINYAEGPLDFAFAWTDGFYSGRPTWLSGSVTWNIDDATALSFVGAANARTVDIDTPAAPLLENNSHIYNLILTHSSGLWTFAPYFQATYVPRKPSIGIEHEAATYGGALLASYSFEASAELGGWNLAGVSIPVRLEYIASTGSMQEDAPNLLYGPRSAAWSVTVTPTYQYDRFFARVEFSYVGTRHATAGSAFGPDGLKAAQARFLVESGFLF